jgi:GNAT superfamily N-acetyltransferase
MHIRMLSPADAVALVPLCTQLGYPATAAQVEERLRRLKGSPDDAVLGAEDDAERVIGWIHVQGHHAVTGDSHAVIAGLVVDQAARGSGVGRALLAEAEHWAVANGYRLVLVRSNVVRDRAHRFYEQLGYTRQKTSHVFNKRLPSG